MPRRSAHRAILFGSSGFCVGVIQFPPLCKGRRGGVDASKGWVPLLPPLAPPYKGGDRLGTQPLLTKEGTPLGTTHVLPSTHTISGRANIISGSIFPDAHYVALRWPSRSRSQIGWKGVDSSSSTTSSPRGPPPTSARRPCWPPAPPRSRSTPSPGSSKKAALQAFVWVPFRFLPFVRGGREG